ATATFDGIAMHVLTENDTTEHWTVFGGYDAELVREKGAWKLARLHLTVREQTGSRDLPRRAASHPVRELASTATPSSVDAFFAALEANDLDALSATLATEVVQAMPLAPDGFPRVVEGRSAVRGLYANIIDHPQRYDRIVLATADPRWVVASFTGAVDVASGTYANAYVNLFELDAEGRIVGIVEHFDPDTLLAGWPGLSPRTHSVHASGAPTDAVSVETVRFERDGVPLVGHLFRPAGADPQVARPAVVVTGSWTSVKEQMPDVYASRLAAEGLIAMTFDFTGFGESGGDRRQLEDPSLKIADISEAARVLASQDGVDPSRVGGLGICASAGYLAHAASRTPELSRIALVAPWLHDEAMARTIYDPRPGGADGLLAAADVAAARADRGESTFVLAASELDPRSAMYVPGNVFDYYLNPTKAAGPHYDNRFDVASWRPWITFDGIGAAEALDKPVHVVHSAQGAVPDGARRFVARAAQATDVWLDAYTQEDFYFRQDAVTAALAEITPFLGG
ncbi:MAG: nuclear transport factor 2 family protein, partial [Myxococcota bacterium]